MQKRKYNETWDDEKRMHYVNVFFLSLLKNDSPFTRTSPSKFVSQYMVSKFFYLKTKSLSDWVKTGEVIAKGWSTYTPRKEDEYSNIQKYLETHQSHIHTFLIFSIFGIFKVVGLSEFIGLISNQQIFFFHVNF